MNCDSQVYLRCEDCGEYVNESEAGAHRCEPSRTKQKVRVKMVCSKCGSDQVRRDAYAIWNEVSQTWELLTVFDNTDCEKCGGECSVNEVPLESEPNKEDEDAETET